MGSGSRQQVGFSFRGRWSGFRTVEGLSFPGSGQAFSVAWQFFRRTYTDPNRKPETLNPQP